MKLVYIVIILTCIYTSYSVLKSESELREGYGILFQFLGELLHGLNKYWLILGYRMPKIYYKTDLHLIRSDFCDGISKEEQYTRLRTSCTRMWSKVLRNKDRTLMLQQELDHLVGSELPAVLPGFDPGDVGMSLDTEVFQESLFSRNDGRNTSYWKDMASRWRLAYKEALTRDMVNKRAHELPAAPTTTTVSVTPAPTHHEGVLDHARQGVRRVVQAFQPTMDPVERAIHYAQARIDEWIEQNEEVVTTTAPPPRRRGKQRPQSRENSRASARPRSLERPRQSRLEPTTTTRQPETEPTRQTRLETTRQPDLQMKTTRQPEPETTRQTGLEPTRLTVQVETNSTGQTKLVRSGPSGQWSRVRHKRKVRQTNYSTLTQVLKQKVQDTEKTLQMTDRLLVELDQKNMTENRTLSFEHVNLTSTDPQRTKRQAEEAGMIIGLIMDGVNMFLDHRSRQKVEKGIKYIKENLDLLKTKMTTLEDQMVSVSQAAFEDIERIMGILWHVQSDLHEVFWTLEVFKEAISENQSELADLGNTLDLVIRMFTSIVDYQEREIQLLMHLISELNHILTALDTLSTGHLSHSVVPPFTLKQMVTHTKETLIMRYPEFELVMNDIPDYYNVPIGSFAYHDGLLTIQVPLLIKPRLQEELKLYQLKTVPVPYHMNPDMVDETESTETYTWLRPTRELLAMSSDTYIGLDRKDLEECMNLGKFYYCQDLFLMKHRNFHTCESAIYHRSEYKEIQELCNFEYYSKLTPDPELLDEGNRILITGLPHGWTYYCLHDDQIPNPVESGDYVIIEKADLCRCSISAGPWYIQENMAYCTEHKDTEFNFYFTTNMAVMIYMFQDELRERNITDVSLFRKPLELDPKEPKILREYDEDVYGKQVDLQRPLALEEVKDSILANREKYGSKADKTLANDNVDEWWDELGESHTSRFLFITGLITVVIALIVILLAFGYFAMKGKLNMLNCSMGRTLSLAALPRGANAANECVCKCEEWQMQIKILGLLLLIQLFLVLIWKLVRYYQKHCMGENIGNLKSAKLAFVADREKTELHMLLLQRFKDGLAGHISLNLGHYFGDINDLQIQGKFKLGDVTCENYCMWSYIHIDWTSLNLRVQYSSLKVPTNIQLTFLHSCWVKQMMSKSNSRIEVKIFARNYCQQIWKPIKESATELLPHVVRAKDPLDYNNTSKKVTFGLFSSPSVYAGDTNRSKNEREKGEMIEMHEILPTTSAQIHSHGSEVYPVQSLRDLEKQDMYATVNERTETTAL